MPLTPRSVRLLMLAAAAFFLVVAFAIRAVSSGALEQFSGTALYASMVYVGVLFVRPRISPLSACGVAVGFCWLVECFQLTGIPADLSSHSVLARLVLGVQFDATDLAWYPVGVVPLAVLHWLVRAKTRVTPRSR